MNASGENVVRTKSFAFAVRAVNLYKYLCEEKKEFYLSKQLLRSGTSIGANVSEALHGESPLDFIHKLAIAQKEASESIFWIELLFATKYITEKEYKSLIADCTELIKLLTSIIKSRKNNLK